MKSIFVLLFVYMVCVDVFSWTECFVALLDFATKVHVVTKWERLTFLSALRDMSLN